MGILFMGPEPSAKPTAQLSKHISEALKKPAKDARLIFVDLNTKSSRRSHPNTDDNNEPSWVKNASRCLKDREKNLVPGQSAYVFVTSIPFHLAVDRMAPGHAALAYGMGISDFAKEGQYRLIELWKQKQKHIDAYDIMDSLTRYPNIPSTFDGSLPLTKEELSNRIEVGQTYFFDNLGEKGLLAEVTSAAVIEAEKRAYFGIYTEDGNASIVTRDMTDNELECYRAYRDSYFGEVPRGPEKTRTIFELYEWMVEAYRNTPRERLLELAKDRSDFPSISKLETMDLCLVLCEGWANNIHRDQETRKRETRSE